MLRGLFGGGRKNESSGSRSGSGFGSKKRRQQEQIRQMNDMTQETIEAYNRRKGIVTDKTEVRAQKYEFPDTAGSMLDKMDTHKKGEMFKYAVLSSPPSSDRAGFFDKLRTYKPKGDKITVTMDKIPMLLLDSAYAEVSLKDAISGSVMRELKDFIIISDILISYTPLDTFYSTSYPVMTTMVDGRKIDDNLVRRAVSSSNVGVNLLMTLDYSVHKSDLGDMSLSIACNNGLFREGKKWGAVKMIMSYTHSDVPLKQEMTEVLGCVHLSHSDMGEYVTDPTKADLLVTGNVLKELKNRYKDHEIEDISKPTDNTVPVSAARTTVGGGVGKSSPDQFIDDIRENFLSKQRQENGYAVDKRTVESVDLGDLARKMKEDGNGKEAESADESIQRFRVASMSDEDDVSVDSNADIGPLSHVMNKNRRVNFD